MFAAKYQLKRVTVAILNYAYHGLLCLMNRKGKSFKQSVKAVTRGGVVLGVKIPPKLFAIF